jgi:hypothetical protein
MGSQSKYLRSLLLVLSMLFGSFGLAGCDDGPMENAGEEMDDAADDVEDGMDDLGDEVN